MKKTSKKAINKVVVKNKYENLKVIGAIRQGLKDVKEGKTIRVVDQDKFFKSL